MHIGEGKAVRAQEEVSVCDIPYSELLSRANKLKGKFQRLLHEVIGYPTVAPRDKKGLRECADAIQRQFEHNGFKVIQWGDPPIVYAERDVGAKKTLMCYHHYDVQSEGDLRLWKSSPWKMVVREGRMFGRGAIDNKGPCIGSLLGFKLVEDALGDLPVNVRFVVEGEEEWSSEILAKFVKKHRGLMKADGCVWELLSATKASVTEICPGMKGCLGISMTVGGPPGFPKVDAHSAYGGAIPSAAWRLIWAVNSLKNSDDNITIDGLSGLIRQPTKEDMAALRNYRGDIGQKLKDSHGIDRFLMNKKGLDLLKALYLEPSLSINGLESGCQGEIHSTIIPAKATAKLDLRLVPDMSSGKVMRLLRAHLDRRGFADIVLTGSGYDAAKTPVTDPFVELVVRTAKEIAAPAPVNTMPLMPMTGPAYLLESYTPFCYCTCYADMDKTYAHGANENWPISSMVNSMAFVARIAEQLGRS